MRIVINKTTKYLISLVKRTVGYIFNTRHKKSNIKIHDLFDVGYYKSSVAMLGLEISSMDPYWHYESIGDKLRVSPHPLFDTHYYHEAYPDVEGSGMSALFHYITHGHTEGRDPHPLFSTDYVRSQTRRDSNPLLDYVRASPGTFQPHPLFDEIFVLGQLDEVHGVTQTVLQSYFASEMLINPSDSFDSASYLEANPDIRDLHPFYHFVRWGRREGRKAAIGSSPLRLLMAEIEQAAALDPDVILPHTNIYLLPHLSRIQIDSVERQLLTRLREAIDPNRPVMVYFAHDMVTGGAERVLCNLVRAQAEAGTEAQILIIATGGKSRAALPWLQDAQATYINIVDELAALGDHKAAGLVIGIFAQVADVIGICVVNSQFGWSLVESYGRALRSFAELSGCAFCYDYDIYGRRAGYAWTDLSHAIRHLHTVITDNATFGDVLRRDLRLVGEQAAKIQVLYQPVSFGLPLTSSAFRGDPNATTVLWAGRFSRQKRVEIAAEVASLLPDVTFLVAGGMKEEAHLGRVIHPRNLDFIGNFTNFDDLPIDRTSAFLYTAAWDGLPNVLLEAGAAGLPIVAPDVGGIAELVTPQTGWLIEDHANPCAYARVLQQVLSDPSEARRRAEGMVAMLHKRHDLSSLTVSAPVILARRYA